MDIKILKKLILEMLKSVKEESYYTERGEGFRTGKIEAIEEILKLMP